MCSARRVWAATNKTSARCVFLRGMQNTLHECTRYEDVIKNVNTLTQAFPYQGKPTPDLRRITQRAQCLAQHKPRPSQRWVTIAPTQELFFYYCFVQPTSTLLWNGPVKHVCQGELCRPPTPPPLPSLGPACPCPAGTQVRLYLS